MNYYAWFSEALQKEFETQELLKESERSTVSLIRHRASGQPFILRSYTGNAEVYRKLLGYECPNLPKTLEVASDGDKNLVLEEYISRATIWGFFCRTPCLRRRKQKRS